MRGSLGNHLLALLCMIIWGASYPVIKIVVSEVDPTLSAFYRFALASIILYIVQKIRFKDLKIVKEDRIRFALGGFFGVGLYFFLENYAITFTTASNVSILIASIPIFTLISQRIVFKEKITLNKMLGVILSFIGILLVVTAQGGIDLSSKNTLGNILAILAALSWVAYNMVTYKFKGKYNSVTITTYQMIWGTIFLSPSLTWAEKSIPSTKAILGILYLTLFCSLVAYLIYIRVLKALGATVLTTYINIQPIISLILAYIFLNENITLKQLLGSSVILIGVLFVNYTKKLEKVYDENGALDRNP